MQKQKTAPRAIRSGQPAALLNSWRAVDPGWLAVFLLATLAAWPFLTRHSLPTFTDAEMHVYRTYEILSAWRAGVPYLRWAPDLFYGFGYPVFHYYAPLAYYLGAAYGAVWGGPVAGVKFVLVASAYLGAAGMYLFVRDRWGGLAAVVSVAAFSLAPYIVYIDPHARGDAPEALAIALAPLLLWAFVRLRRTASPGDVVLAALLLAAVVLAHNLMALVFFGLLLAWLAWDVVFGQTFFGAWVLIGGAHSTPARRRVVAALAAAVALGLGLAAFMWLPAILERDAVQFRNVAQGTFFDFRRYFLDVGELIAPAQIFDLAATQMRFHYSVGLPQWVSAVLGALTVFSTRRRRPAALFFAFAALGLAYLMLPASIRVWEAIPQMAYFQFPTRFLGPAAVVFGILAGAAISWADGLRWKWGQTAMAGAAVAVCVLGAMPLLYPPQWPDFGPVSAQRILDTELNGRGVGTTSANDFLPVGTKVVPPPQDGLLRSYKAGQVDKLNRATLPAGTQATLLHHGPEDDHYAVAGGSAFVFRMFTFYFPGWTAYVDGVKTNIMPSEPEGWITFWVPAGAHDLTVRLENTPVRWIAWIISALAALGLAGHLIWRLRLPIEGPQHQPMPLGQLQVFTAVILVGMVFRAADDRAGWLRVQSTGHQALVAMRQEFVPLQDDVALLGFDLPQSQANPGDSVPVTLYWKALAPMRVNLRVFVHLIGPDGQLWGQSDKWNPADFPTGRWPVDHYVRDEHQARLRSDAPPGKYQVIAGLWDGDTGLRMHQLDANGQPTSADGIVLSDSFDVLP
jgi:hypothetical protein